MKMPDYPSEWIVAVIGQIVACAVAFGVSLTPDQQKSILALAATLGVAIVFAGQQIRKHRAQNAANVKPPSAPPPAA